MSVDLSHLFMTHHSLLFPSFSWRSNILNPSVPFPVRSNHQSLPVIPYMNLPFLPDSPHLPSAVLRFSGSRGLTSHSFPASFSLPSSFYIFLSCITLPFFLPPCTSWDSTIQRTSLLRPKALTPSASILPSFSPSQRGSQRDSDYNQVTAASAMPINVGGLKTEQGKRGKKCLYPHLHTLPY